IPDSMFALADYVTPNETEAELLTGIKVTDDGTAELACRKLCSRGVKNTVITLGRQGCFFFDGQKGEHIPGFPVKSVDTTAAGDVFNGALAVAIAEGVGIRGAIDIAQKASSISVTRPGALQSAPYRSEVIQ
ncbi:MAG: PfkB family carbohydrate kinase, partial [Victivallaceae bacterium]|nr:PfkB family carbohydrate kinase [Victivallaceae bacterium]